MPADRAKLEVLQPIIQHMEFGLVTSVAMECDLTGEVWSLPEGGSSNEVLARHRLDIRQAGPKTPRNAVRAVAG